MWKAQRAYAFDGTWHAEISDPNSFLAVRKCVRKSTPWWVSCPDPERDGAHAASKLERIKKAEAAIATRRAEMEATLECNVAAAEMLAVSLLIYVHV